MLTFSGYNLVLNKKEGLQLIVL